MDKLNSIKKVQTILEDLKRGKFVIVVDEHTRENEGDLVLAGEKATPKKLNFMIKYARGLMCLPCEAKIIDKLRIPLMVKELEDKFETPFTVSIDATKGITTGVSVSDRMKVIKVLLNPSAKRKDIVMPGHSFPLRANPDLLAKRHGHTEATIELLKIANLKPVGIIEEIMTDNGSMARLPYLKKFAKKHNVNIISIPEIIEYKTNI